MVSSAIPFHSEEGNTIERDARQSQGRSKKVCFNEGTKQVSEPGDSMEWVERAIDEGSEGEVSDEDIVKGPGKFPPDDYPNWKEGLQIRLRSMKGAVQLGPLYYVIRPTLPRAAHSKNLSTLVKLKLRTFGEESLGMLSMLVVSFWSSHLMFRNM